MNELQKVENLYPEVQKELKRIAGMKSKRELRKLLLDLLGFTVNHVILMAAAVRRLDELGDDLSDVQIALLPQIRRLAYGQIVPELLVRLQGNPTLITRASGLPLPDQRRIAEGQPIKVLEAGGDHRMIPPLQLTRAEVRQVFAGDHLRDDAEQAAWLRQEKQRVPRTKRPDNEVYLDRKRGGIIVADRFISATDLAHYLAELTSIRTKRVAAGQAKPK